MKKIITMVFCIITTTIFAEINDNLGIFNSEEIKKIDEVIDRVEKEKNVKIYLNTVIGEESFQLEIPQKTIIITYQKIDEGLVVTELKFTEDLKMSDKSQEIDIILDSLKAKMFAKKYVEYTQSLIKEIEKLVLEDDIMVEGEYSELEGNKEKKKGFFRKIFSKNP